jgi:hypothetical protein
VFQETVHGTGSINSNSCWSHNVHVVKHLDEGSHCKFLPELVVPESKF